MKLLLCLSVIALIVASLTTAASARELDVAHAQKTEIRYGQIGPRDTLIFYTFADQDAVLQLNIQHVGGKFTLTGKMQLFKEGTGAESIGKWINNQHSCGLFPDEPTPTATVVLPADACSVVESKLVGVKAGGGGRIQIDPVDAPSFEDYALKIRVSDLKMEGFRLESFKLDTGAFVKVGPAA